MVVVAELYFSFLFTCVCATCMELGGLFLFFFLERDMAYGRDTIVTFTLSGHFERMISRDMENWIYGQ